MLSNILRRSLLAPSVRSASSPSLLTRRTFVSTSSARYAVTVPTGLPEREQTIWEKLNAKFSPSQLQVEDISGGCGSFYAIVIASDAFKGLTMVKQHKLVTETLKQEIEGIHGLQIKTIAK